MTTDKVQWDEYISRKAIKYNISSDQVVDILCFCYNDQLAYNLRWKKYGILLDTLYDKEVDKAIKRTLNKVDVLEELSAMKKNVSETDVDFILEDGSPIRTSYGKITITNKPSEVPYV